MQRGASGLKQERIGANARFRKGWRKSQTPIKCSTLATRLSKARTTIASITLGKIVPLVLRASCSALVVTLLLEARPEASLSTWRHLQKRGAGAVAASPVAFLPSASSFRQWMRHQGLTPRLGATRTRARVPPW